MWKIGDIFKDIVDDYSISEQRMEAMITGTEVEEEQVSRLCCCLRLSDLYADLLLQDFFTLMARHIYRLEQYLL